VEGPSADSPEACPTVRGGQGPHATGDGEPPLEAVSDDREGEAPRRRLLQQGAALAPTVNFESVGRRSPDAAVQTSELGRPLCPVASGTGEGSGGRGEHGRSLRRHWRMRRRPKQN